MVKRRPLFVVLCLVALSLVACRRASDGTRLHLALFANVTHAPGLTGTESGRFARALGSVALDTHFFNAGPTALEALLAGSVDMAYVGPSPAATAFVRTRGTGLHVVAGATSGGALFVTRHEAAIHSPGDLHGKRIATPGLGGTQDVALRAWLEAQHLALRERGGDVQIIPLGNPETLAQFQRGEIDAAWMPEPWASRLVQEAHADVLFDERDLWPDHRFATTVLVVRTAYLRASPEAVRAMVRAHAAEVSFAQRDPAGARALVARAIERVTGKAIPARLVEAAWSHMTFTTDPMEPSLRANAQRAHALGYLASEDLTGLVDRSMLPVE